MMISRFVVCSFCFFPVFLILSDVLLIILFLFLIFFFVFYVFFLVFIIFVFLNNFYFDCLLFVLFF